MRRLLPRAPVAAAVTLVAVALAAPGSASAATTTVCPKGYSVLSTSQAWWYPLADFNKDGFICLKTDKWGTPVAITDNTI